MGVVSGGWHDRRDLVNGHRRIGELPGAFSGVVEAARASGDIPRRVGNDGCIPRHKVPRMPITSDESGTISLPLETVAEPLVLRAERPPYSFRS